MSASTPLLSVSQGAKGGALPVIITTNVNFFPLSLPSGWLSE